MRILIVEDEFQLADVIKSKLEKEGYIVDVSIDGEEGLYQVLLNIYELVILDVMLPGINGFEILKELREKGIKSKVIMLTAKTMLEDRLQGFHFGANDYVTKPFYIDELIARVHAQLKVDNDGRKDIIQYGDIELNISTYQLHCINSFHHVELVCKEYQLLEYFMNNPQQILSKEQIYNKVWGIDNVIESNNLEVYISFIRKKLKAIGSNVNIKASRGLGYRLEYQCEKTKE